MFVKKIDFCSLDIDLGGILLVRMQPWVLRADVYFGGGGLSMLECEIWQKFPL